MIYVQNQDFVDKEPIFAVYAVKMLNLAHILNKKECNYE